MKYPDDTAVNPENNTIDFFWVSRDSHPRTGALEPVVDLWYIKPDRERYSTTHDDPTLAGARWHTFDRSENGATLVGHKGRYTLEQCIKWCGTLPETDRELLCVGRK